MSTKLMIVLYLVCIDKQFHTGTMAGDCTLQTGQEWALELHPGQEPFKYKRQKISSLYFLSLLHHQFYFPRQMHLDYLVFPCEFLEIVDILGIIITLLQFVVNEYHS